MKSIAYSFLLVLAVSCSSGSTQQEKEMDYYNGLPEYYTNLVKAHGGLEKWKGFKTLEYDLIHPDDSTKNEHYTLDLINRKDLTEADSFKIGYNGTEVWVAPNKKAYPGKSARFYHNLYSYFLTLPFMVADPGVKYSKDTITVGGKFYEVINIAFEEGVGDADKDTYKILVDPSSHQMKMLLYTVTYYSGEAQTNYNALSYEDWKDINGVTLPSHLVGYKYTDGEIGDQRYEVRFSNIQLKKESPNQNMFTIPAEAEIDSLIVH